MQADLTKDNYSGTGVTNGSTATRGTNVGTNVMEGDRSQYTTGNTTGEMARDAEGNVIDRKYYTSVEDRPVDQELVRLCTCWSSNLLKYLKLIWCFPFGVTIACMPFQNIIGEGVCLTCTG